MVLTWKAWLRLGFALLKGCRDWRPTTITQLVPLETLPPQQRMGGTPDGYRVQVRLRLHVSAERPGCMWLVDRGPDGAPVIEITRPTQGEAPVWSSLSPVARPAVMRNGAGAA